MQYKLGVGTRAGAGLPTKTDNLQLLPPRCFVHCMKHKSYNMGYNNTDLCMSWLLAEQGKGTRAEFLFKPIRAAGPQPPNPQKAWSHHVRVAPCLVHFSPVRLNVAEWGTALWGGWVFATNGTETERNGQQPTRSAVASPTNSALHASQASFL